MKRLPLPLLLWLASLVLLTVLLGRQAFSFFAPVAGCLLVGILIIPVHEAGHALAGALVGLRVGYIVVGTGRVVFQRRIAGVLCQLCLIPLGGHTMAAPYDGSRFLRARYWIFVLGGPLFHAAVLFLTWWLLQRAGSKGPLHEVLQTVYWAVGVQLLVNLIPFKTSLHGMPFGTDGRQLLTIPFMERDEIDALYAGQYLLEGREHTEAGDHAAALAAFERGVARYPGVPVLRLGRATAMDRLGRHDEALSEVSSVLPTLDGPLRAMAFNDWSWYALRRGDDRDLKVADRRSAEALAQLPEVPGVVGTRGGVLLWQGRIAEALPLLRRAYDGASSKSSRATESCMLTIAYAALGERAEANKFFQIARELDADHEMISTARAAVAAMSDGTRTVSASRGSRAIVIHDDALELIGGGPRTPKRIDFESVTWFHVGLTARGRGQLTLVYPDGRWHMPLDPGALAFARTVLHALIPRGSRPPIVAAHEEAAHNARLTPVGRTVAVLVFLFSSAGMMQGGVEYSDSIVLGLALTASFAPGPGPLLALGTAVVVKQLNEIAGVSVPVRDGGASRWFGPIVMLAIGFGAWAVGWAARRTGPAGRKRGVAVAEGILIFLMLPGAMTIATMVKKGLTGNRVLALSADMMDFSTASIALGVAVLAVRRGFWRVSAAAIGLVGVAFLVMGSEPFHELVVLSSLGARTPRFVWASAQATPLRHVQLPAGAVDVQVSPGGSSWGARVPTGSSMRHRATRSELQFGDFAGHVQGVPGEMARFIDDRRVLILARAGETWQVSEADVTSPSRPLRTATLAPSESALLFREEPDGPVHIAFEIDAKHALGDMYRHWVWLQDSGLTPVRAHDEPPGQFDVSSHGAYVAAGEHVLRCPTRAQQGHWLCETLNSAPWQLVALEPGGAYRRLASIPGAAGPVTVQPGGRAALLIGGRLAVVDPTRRTVTRLSLPTEAGAAYTSTQWVDGNVALTTASYQSDQSSRVELVVLAIP